MLGNERNVENNLKFISPFGVATSMHMVICIQLIKYGHENPDGAQELKTVEIVLKNNEFEVVPRGPTGVAC